MEILNVEEGVLVLVGLAVLVSFFFAGFGPIPDQSLVYSSQESSQKSRDVELSRSALCIIGRFGLSEA